MQNVIIVSDVYVLNNLYIFFFFYKSSLKHQNLFYSSHSSQNTAIPLFSVWVLICSWLTVSKSNHMALIHSAAGLIYTFFLLFLFF